MEHTAVIDEPPKVLLVEDEPRYREMLFEAVTTMGFIARGVGTSEQALRALSALRYEIVILDLNLPGMNGIDLLELIRRDFPLTQVIILTGFGSLEAAKRAMRLDAVDMLTKPCELDELELSLARALGRSRAQGIVSTSHAVGGTRASTASLEEVEKLHILEAMKRNKGNRHDAAAELGISLRTLYNRLRTYNYTDPPADANMLNRLRRLM